MDKLEQLSAQYLADEGNNCPYCGSCHLIKGNVNVEDTEAHRNVKCYSCHKEWTEMFEMEGIGIKIKDYYGI